jgi:hypothetical protein
VARQAGGVRVVRRHGRRPAAVEQLRLVFAELQAVTLRDTVSFHMAHRLFDAMGRLLEPDGCAAAADVMLDVLVWWGDALRSARHRRVTASA